ncbi:hypothetical protein BD324DRAFT_680758 [Kockovaella imperatae]|uniref:Uncharacterized protein n=1 Tax=Kockovaella imperatae TaxID=4999 RepID=A0A1Y1UK52_9TREE|nr:hypothetical protein BD324DRAFT_680758 [Kockovaella imperatae]ORX37884.1 hypothetical protein BD324DRAFT_680758 [Kockovaella imperatae]
MSGRIDSPVIRDLDIDLTISLRQGEETVGWRPSSEVDWPRTNGVLDSALSDFTHSLGDKLKEWMATQRLSVDSAAASTDRRIIFRARDAADSGSESDAPSSSGASEAPRGRSRAVLSSPEDSDEDANSDGESLRGLKTLGLGHNWFYHSFQRPAMPINGFNAEALNINVQLSLDPGTALLTWQLQHGTDWDKVSEGLTDALGTFISSVASDLQTSLETHRPSLDTEASKTNQTIVLHSTVFKD